MILVTVGTNGPPFDRLLRAVEHLSTTEAGVVQHGPSTIRPSWARCVQFLRFEELVSFASSARVIISHGGVGSILVALRSGKLPFVVPRLRQFGEAVDDHQLELSRRLHDAGLVILVEDPENLGSLLQNEIQCPALAKKSGSLIQELSAYIGATLAPQDE